MMISQRKQVSRFIRHFHIQKTACVELESVIKDLGYSLIEFSHTANDDATETLLQSLGLQEYAQTTSAFTYADPQIRLIFILEHLAEEEKLILLAHEVGHIWNKHFDRPGIFGEDIIQENEANAFLYYLLDDGILQRINRFCAYHTKRIIASIAFIAVLVCCLLVFSPTVKFDDTVRAVDSEQEQEDFDQKYWVTTSGSKYHVRDCKYLKGKSDSLTSLPLATLNQVGYEPCSVCIKEDTSRDLQ